MLMVQLKTNHIIFLGIFMLVHAKFPIIKGVLGVGKRKKVLGVGQVVG